MKKFVSIALGCKVNAYEISSVNESFIKAGFLPAEQGDKVDIALINTCSVTSNADAKSRKSIRKLAKNYPDAILIVMGCYAQINNDLMNTIPEIDILLGTSNRDKILDYIEEFSRTGQKINAVGENPRIFKYEELKAPSLTRQTRAYLKIQDGCDAFCTYCIIPLARGKLRSRDPRAIIEEAKTLVKSGYQEIVLTGIHTGAYGKDLDNINFTDIVEMILDACPTLYKLRVSSIEENEIDERFLLLMQKDNRVARHLHIPLQSGSDRTLKRMNRRYSSADFKAKIAKIRTFVPDVAITTDVIVGFPGESEEDFSDTIDLIKDVEFSMLHVFPYSARSRTPAAKFSEVVSAEVKKERVQTLLTLSEELHLKYAMHFIGQEMTVLIEHYDASSDTYRGHTSNYLEVRVKSEKDITHQVINIIYYPEISEIL